MPVDKVSAYEAVSQLPCSLCMAALAAAARSRCNNRQLIEHQLMGVVWLAGQHCGCGEVYAHLAQLVGSCIVAPCPCQYTAAVVAFTSEPNLLG